MVRYILGVDEAGRGPLAGPVSIGVVCVPVQFDIRKAFPGIADSKKLSAQKREELYVLLQQFASEGSIQFCVRYSAASTIDRIGMTKAVKLAVCRGVRTLAPEPTQVKILLDGLLHAPKEYEQKTIIHGDETEPSIMLAAIAAKVRRDRLMRRWAKIFPAYGFELHKGYGTEMHRKVLKTAGPSEIHRRSFCKKIISVVQ